MTEENRRALDERWERVQKTVALQEADRVPFVPKMGAFVAQAYGLTQYDLMKDLRNLEPCFKSYLKTYSPDMVWPLVSYPLDPCEMLGAQYIRLPGPSHGLSLSSPFQIMDGTYMEDDEFDEFLLDPTHFLLTRVLPRKYSRLGALSKLYCREIYDLTLLMELSALGEDDMQKALGLLMRSGELCKRHVTASGTITRMVEELGFPTRGGTVLAPFDAYADSLRGLIQAVIDVKEFPDEVLAVTERIEKMNTARAIKAAKARGDRFLYIPLHAGGDEFMSNENYAKFYWPGLKRTIEAIIDAGIIPYVFCEGRYNTRLDFLCDVPKGKVVYMFEQVDIKRVKQTVGQHACICGTLPSTLLIHGTKEDVVNKTRELLDICAPGGGFFMDCSIVVDTAIPENFAAWQEATFTYGRY